MNTKQITGLTVVALDAGERLGSVSEIALAPDGRAVVALAVQDGSGLLSTDTPTRWLPAEGVHAVGPDAVTVEGASALRDAAPAPESVKLTDLAKRKVLTEGGVYVGQVASVEVDEHGLRVTHVEVSPGFFKSNRMVPANQVLNIGEELVIVADAVCGDQHATEGEYAEHPMVVGDVEPGSAP